MRKRAKILCAVVCTITAVIVIGGAVYMEIHKAKEEIPPDRNDQDTPQDNDIAPNEKEDLTGNIPAIQETLTPPQNTQKPTLDVSTMERPVAPGVSDVTVEYETKESPGDRDAE